MAFLRDLADRVRERATAPALQRQVLPQVTPLPRQIGGIGSVLPTQTITLPNGQTVQIPQINMEEINANLLASGVQPNVDIGSASTLTPAEIDTGMAGTMGGIGVTPKLTRLLLSH